MFAQVYPSLDTTTIDSTVWDFVKYVLPVCAALITYIFIEFKKDQKEYNKAVLIEQREIKETIIALKVNSDVVNKEIITIRKDIENIEYKINEHDMEIQKVKSLFRA